MLRRRRREGAPAQRAPHALRRILQRFLQPVVERALGTASALRLGQHLEQRIDAGLDRPFAQQIGAEAVNGADVRFLEMLQRLDRAAAAPTGSLVARSSSRACRRRSFSSPAAFSVNVTATIALDRGARPVAERR